MFSTHRSCTSDSRQIVRTRLSPLRSSEFAVVVNNLGAGSMLACVCQAAAAHLMCDVGYRTMERTSSLDLFRGSADGSFFSDLNFLDPGDSQFISDPNERQQVSQAVPCSVPLPQRPGQGPATLQSSTYPSALSFGAAWPQSASRQWSHSQPVGYTDTFLQSSSNHQQRTDISESQPDSLALLDDDTALGFADDCFRRESDLFLSQDKVLQHDALLANLMPASNEVSDLPSTHLPTHQPMADSSQQQLPVNKPSVHQSTVPPASEIVKASSSASRLDVQAQDSAEGHDEAASNEDPHEVRAHAATASHHLSSQDSRPEDEALAASNHHKPGAKPDKRDNDSPRSIDSLKPRSQAEDSVGCVVKRAAAGDQHTKHHSVAQLVASRAAHLNMPPSTTVSAETSLTDKQGHVTGQTQKLKLAVQDYQPSDAQALRHSTAHIQGMYKYMWQAVC